jgi:hypothetical protein
VQFQRVRELENSAIGVVTGAVVGALVNGGRWGAAAGGGLAFITSRVNEVKRIKDGKRAAFRAATAGVVNTDCWWGWRESEYASYAKEGCTLGLPCCS